MGGFTPLCSMKTRMNGGISVTSGICIAGFIIFGEYTTKNNCMKGLLYLLAMGAVIGFTACEAEDDMAKQDWTCTCDDGAGTTATTSIPDATRSTAESSCSNLASSGINCALD